MFFMREVEFSHVSNSFGSTQRREDLSLNEFVTPSGPSRCGQTALLKSPDGLEAADDGNVLTGGEQADSTLSKARDGAMVRSRGCDGLAGHCSCPGADAVAGLRQTLALRTTKFLSLVGAGALHAILLATNGDTRRCASAVAFQAARRWLIEGLTHGVVR